MKRTVPVLHGLPAGTEPKRRLVSACSWLFDTAQVKTMTQVSAHDRRRHHHRAWVGAIRGEYRVSEKRWGFFCPIWHSGQAIKSAVMAQRIIGDRFIPAAVKAADFIRANQVTSGPDTGLILAYEDHPDKVNTSAQLEALDGLFYLSGLTGDRRFADAALASLTWVADRAYCGNGLFLDLYDPRRRRFVPFDDGEPGRPMLDDGVFLTAYRLTGDARFRKIALATAARLLRDEHPEGNWIRYQPCRADLGRIHPRHTYWWGHPFLQLYHHTGNKKYFAIFKRSVAWYQRALRRDGGMFRGTYTDFSTDSFGHATSAAACAVIEFIDCFRANGDRSLVPFIERGLSHCMRMQFVHARDKDLNGAVLEKVLPMDGTDASPYHIRDLGTIFFIQALARYADPRCESEQFISPLLRMTKSSPRRTDTKHARGG